MAPKDKKDPREDIGILNGIIKSADFRRVHLLYGNEDYLRNQFRDKLVEAMTGGDAGMNFDHIVGSDVVAEQIIDKAETLPFFAERRVILIEDSGWGKSGADAIADYIKECVCETTCIVICEKEVDKRGRLYKAVLESGLVSEFMTQEEGTLIAWIIKTLKDEGFSISQSDASYLLNTVGSDMTYVHNEIQKLIGYSLGKSSIGRLEIDAICTRRIENRIFEMCDAIALRRQKQALDMYYDLIDLREAPIKILVMVTKQFDTLLKIKDMEVKRKNDNEIAQKIGKQTWMLRGYKAQTSHYTLEELKTVFRKCLETDEKIKTGRITDDIGLEMLLIELTNS